MYLGVCPTFPSSSLELFWGKGESSSGFFQLENPNLEKPHFFSSAQLCIDLQGRNSIIPLLGKASLGTGWAKIVTLEGPGLVQLPFPGEEHPWLCCWGFPALTPGAGLISAPHWVGIAQFVSWDEKLLLLRVNLNFSSLLVWVCDHGSPSQRRRGNRSHSAELHSQLSEESSPLPAPGAGGAPHCSFPAGFGALGLYPRLNFPSWRSLGCGCSSTRSFGMAGMKEKGQLQGCAVMEQPGLCRWNIKPLSAVADPEMHMRCMSGGSRQVHRELSPCFGDLGLTLIYSQVSPLFLHSIFLHAFLEMQQLWIFNSAGSSLEY